MKTLKWILTLLLPCLTAAGLLAKDYQITVTANKDTKKITAYTHSDPKTGAFGHQFAKKGEKITWVCDGSCKSVTITFSVTPPCDGGTTNPCKINDGSLINFYKYTATADLGNGAMTDPDDPEI